MLFPVSSIVALVAVCDIACARRSKKDDFSTERHASEEGLVGGGNYTYYTLETSADKPVFLTVLLHSLEGDADLYIAGRNRRPTFDVEEHSFQSTTCGDEIIVVPAHFIREESPIVIGVYGHPRFNASKYYVEVLWEPQLVNEPDNNSYDDYGSQMIGNESDGTSDNQKSDGWDDFLKTAVLHIMQIIVEVLLS